MNDSTLVHVERKVYAVQSDISYYCDLSVQDGLVIPLGYVIEVLLPDLHGLGMIARTRLTPDELLKVGEIGQRLVANPFDHLSNLLDEAWNEAAPGEVLDQLAQCHVHSLNFASPTRHEVPPRLAEVTSSSRIAVMLYLAEALDDANVKLLPVAPAAPPALVPWSQLTALEPLEEAA